MYFAPICWISISSFNETTKCNFSSLKHAQSADIEQSSVFPTTNKLFEDLFLDSFLYLLLSGNLFIPSKPEKHPIWGCCFFHFSDVSCCHKSPDSSRLFSLTELLRALHPGPQRSGDQSLQDGGRRPRRRGKPHFLQNLRPDHRGEGRVDQQHQVRHI